MNRRDMFRGLGTGFVAAGIAGRLPARAAARSAEPSIYEKIGVRPIINCKGTFTIISGSLTLPEVKAAMDEASRHYVHLDELMDGVGKRLSELTKAEWGIITAGCAAAATHATAACIAGSNPEKMQRLPTDLLGLKDEVVMPRQSRNVYDHAIRMLGVKMITPATREEFLASFSPKTAMLAILGENLKQHPMQFEEMVEAAHKHGVPVFVDAAAEPLTIPNTYLTKGADMVAYSGGKSLRGPQCAGVLLGKKDLLQAAWINSAPHHAFGRSLKVGKEEIMGMLTAVEMWTKRDHDAEWKQWERWLGTFKEKLAGLSGVTTEIEQPEGPSNFAPSLKVSWDAEKLGAGAAEVSEALLSGTPRIIMSGYGNWLSIMPWMMMPGDDKIAAQRLYEVLQNPPRREKPPVHPSSAVLTGQWDVHIEYGRGEANHTLWLDEKEGKVVGQHRGEFLTGDLRGSREGDRVNLRSNHHYQGTGLNYRFEGTLAEKTMTGTVDLGEYGKARFEAKRHWA
ncbi:MAG TPA: aminotransferase class V-fold PLP-dependent enzyme [Bryobacteraceae bacterium]|nr:aminotransferase class V-fold PLP-dependent enzyme [Bryobacteraceae bacterium]